MMKRTTKFFLIQILAGISLLMLSGCNSAEQQAEQKKSDSLFNVAYRETEQQQIAECNYELAREKSHAKTKSLGFYYVGDHDMFNETKEPATCFIRFAYHVKEVYTYPDGSTEIGDKIFDLHLRYQKINDNFEYLGGYIMDPVRQTRRDLD